MSFHEKSFSQLTVPIFIKISFLTAIFLTDTIFLSRISDAAVAGVGSVIPILVAVMGVTHAFASSGTSLLAQAVSAENTRRVGATFLVMLSVCLLVGGLLSLGLGFFAGNIGLALGLQGAVNQASRDYLTVIAPLFFLDGLFINLNAMLFAHGKTQWNMLAAIASCMTNLAVNLLFYCGFIPGHQFGVHEVGLATIIAQFPPLCIMAYAVWIHIGFRFECYWDELRASAHRIFSIALPATLEPLSYNASQLMMYAVLAGIGANSMAAFTYGKSTFILLASSAGVAVGIGTQIFVGHYQGLGQYSAAYARVRKSLGFFLPCAIVVVVIMNLFSQSILAWFTASEDVIAQGKLVFLAMFLIEPMKSISSIVYPCLRGSGDVKRPVCMSILSHWVFCYGVSWYLSGIFGLVGVLVGIVADETFRGLYHYMRWRSGAWEKSLARLNLPYK